MNKSVKSSLAKLRNAGSKKEKIGGNADTYMSGGNRP